MSHVFIAALNKAMSEALDPANPETIAARAAVDMDDLLASVKRLSDYAVVYELAYDLMIQNPRAHPLAAFLRAVDSDALVLKGGRITDAEFREMLIAWRAMCNKDK